MRTSLARREIASELSLVKLMTFTACFCWDFLSSRRTVRTAERVSAGEREEASMVTSAPSFSDFEGEEGAGVVVVVVVVDVEGDEIAAFALTSAATLVSIFNAFSDCFLKYALLLFLLLAPTPSLSLKPSSPWFVSSSLLQSSRFFCTEGAAPTPTRRVMSAYISRNTFTSSIVPTSRNNRGSNIVARIAALNILGFRSPSEANVFAYRS